MSQKKTVVQGLEPSDNNNGRAQRGVGQNFYSRGTNSAARGTVVPGMGEAPYTPSGNVAEAAPSQTRQQRPIRSGKPIVGFLYSISRTPVGEYWPIQMGKNTIGQSGSSDIVLAEGTVSNNHAVIITRQGKNGIIAAIKDTESTNGTMLNGEMIDFEAEECHNGDVITIGNNYKLLFLLIDAAASGLSTSKEFIPTNEPEPEEEIEDNMPPSFSDRSTRPGGFDPFTGNIAGWTPNRKGGSSDGTIGMDGQTPTKSGGTIPM